MLKGIDCSKWQGAIDFNSLKSAVDFVILRSSYGDGYTDAQYSRNRSECNRLAIPKGYYHYSYPQYNTPEAEADWFLKVLGEPDENDLLCLDFEEKYADPVGWSVRFLDRLSVKLRGYKPLLYINLNLNQTYDWKPIVDNSYGLWLAYWDYKPEASVPKTDWNLVAMRQWSNRETFPGIVGSVDANVFYGNLDAFRKYGYHKPSPPEPTPEPTPEPIPEPVPPPPTPTPPPPPPPQPEPPPNQPCAEAEALKKVQEVIWGKGYIWQKLRVLKVLLPPKK